MTFIMKVIEWLISDFFWILFGELYNYFFYILIYYLYENVFFVMLFFIYMILDKKCENYQLIYHL
jgi:hypothetical protein